MIFRNGDYDILIVAEGTYPYVRGGVSGWIHQLITGLKEFNFGVVFIGSSKSDYKEIQYELPDNLTYFYVEYLFKKEETPQPRHIGRYKSFKTVEKLHKWFDMPETGIPKHVGSLEFYNTTASFEKFLYSESSWDFIQENYLKNTPDSPFIDYFWSVRNMHTPIWRVINIANNIKKPKTVHSPSTGYAGFLASVLSLEYGIPFILTEHGIYVRERKIDMLNTQLFQQNKTVFQKKLGELAYAKQMWIKFFESLGKITYESADEIISLFEQARDIQVYYGADRNKTRTIPNGVDVKGLCALRKENIPKVISLIGRVVPIKDIKTFIKAVKIAAERIKGLEGWIVGPEDEDETYAKECRTLVDLLGLEDKIKFLGFQDIKNILPKTGLLTLSSISEGMPLTVIEGFAAGIPAVTTDVGSCSDLIYGGCPEDRKLGKAGETVPIANPTELANAYVKLLQNENIYKKARETAIKRVEKFYTKEKFLDSYKNIYLKYMGDV
jgi:glycosyltransferase involved in cell wall biosynthesis